MKRKSSFSSFVFLFLLITAGCEANNRYQPIPNDEPIQINENPYPTVADIPLPKGYKRVKLKETEFGTWLRRLPLKKDLTVYLYNGQLKANQSAQFAVIDISVGKKNLQQCADAAMRLRAEFLYQSRRFEEIQFRDNEAGIYSFTPPYSHENLIIFLDKVFAFCGSASLSKQMVSVRNFASIQPGDVLVKGGFPGHVVMVIDVAENSEGEKVYLICQSYMPAQDIHVLKNPAQSEGTAWYQVTTSPKILTPEFEFSTTDLKRW